MIRGSFAKRDLQPRTSYRSSSPCTRRKDRTCKMQDPTSCTRHSSLNVMSQRESKRERLRENKRERKPPATQTILHAKCRTLNDASNDSSNVVRHSSLGCRSLFIRAMVAGLFSFELRLQVSFHSSNGCRSSNDSSNVVRHSSFTVMFECFSMCVPPT